MSFRDSITLHIVSCIVWTARASYLCTSDPKVLFTHHKPEHLELDRRIAKRACIILAIIAIASAYSCWYSLTHHPVSIGLPVGALFGVIAIISAIAIIRLVKVLNVIQKLSKQPSSFTPSHPYDLSNYSKLNEDIIHYLANPVRRTDSVIINTGLTDLLAHYVFDFNHPHPELNDLLRRLADEAKSNPLARLDLTRPNNYYLDGSRAPSTPQNTPLALLIKGGLEAVHDVLPSYESADLKYRTPRGNTSLHLALATGQIKMALAILKRAKKLAIVDQLLVIKNYTDKTASELFHFMVSKTTIFGYLDAVDTHLGRGEIEQTRAIEDFKDLFGKCRQRIFAELKELGIVNAMDELSTLRFESLLNQL